MDNGVRKTLTLNYGSVLILSESSFCIILQTLGHWCVGTKAKCCSWHVLLQILPPHATTTVCETLVWMAKRNTTHTFIKLNFVEHLPLYSEADFGPITSVDVRVTLTSYKFIDLVVVFFKSREPEPRMNFNNDV